MPQTCNNHWAMPPRAGTAALIALTATLADPAPAAPFNRQLGIVSPGGFSETSCKDIIVRADGTIAGTGRFDTVAPEFASFPGLWFAGADGLPGPAWVFDTGVPQYQEGLALRETADGDLVLSLAYDDFSGRPDKLAIVRFDPMAGAISYARGYAAEASFSAWGLEVAGETGAVAGAVRLMSAGTVGLIIGFDVATGLPIVNQSVRWNVPGFPQLTFSDVHLDGASGRIYAVGDAAVFDDAVGRFFQYAAVACFEPTGAVVWAFGYSVLLDGENERAAYGDSITRTAAGDIAIIGETFGNFGGGMFALLVDDATGSPITAQQYSFFDPLIPAVASFETLSDGSLLVAATRSFGDGGGYAAMLNLDPATLELNWYYEDGFANSFGHDAVEQPGEGLLLTGRSDSFDFDPINLGSDLLLVRTGLDGFEPCGGSGSPEARQLGATATPLELAVEALPAPIDLVIDVQRVAVREIDRCWPECRADLDGSGSLDLFDILTFFQLLGEGDGLVDFNDDFQLDIFDILAFFELFGQGC